MIALGTEQLKSEDYINIAAGFVRSCQDQLRGGGPAGAGGGGPGDGAGGGHLPQGGGGGGLLGGSVIHIAGECSEGAGHC